MALTALVLYSGGQLGGSPSTLVQGQANVAATIISTATFTNTDTVPHTLNIYLVRSGGTAGAGNALVSSQQLAAGQAYVSPEIQGQVLGVGDTIQAAADTANKITCAGITGFQVTN